jgi:hypothetical protein
MIWLVLTGCWLSGFVCGTHTHHRRYLMPTVNPETQTVHFQPGEKCNLDDAKKDEGAKPYEVTVREAVWLLTEDGFHACENED